MRLQEFNDGLHEFVVVVRVEYAHGSTVVKTKIEAESVTHARVLLSRLYGSGNVLSFTERMDEEGTKVLSPEALRVKSMTDQAKRLQQQAKQMKAQNALKKAQKKLAASR
jgi:hypothetical protein